MYSPAFARSSRTPAPHRTRPLSQRTQMMARGPGWRLAEREDRSWHIQLTATDVSPGQTWSHMLRTMRELADSTGLRPLLIDMRKAARLSRYAAQACAHLLALFECSGLELTMLVGHDLIGALRIHALLRHEAPKYGRCVHDEAEMRTRTLAQPPPIAIPRSHARGPRAPRV